MIMLDVIIALLPAAVASVIVFGPRSLLVTGACTASCIIFEFGFEKLCRRENTIGDLSAVVTGILLAFNLTVSISRNYRKNSYDGSLFWLYDKLGISGY